MMKNVDLVVAIVENVKGFHPIHLHNKTASEIYALVIMPGSWSPPATAGQGFTKAEHMTAWEFAAYDAYGQERCDKEKINTLEDLFGIEFAEPYFALKEILINREEIQEKYEAIKALNLEISNLYAQNESNIEILEFSAHYNIDGKL